MNRIRNMLLASFNFSCRVWWENRHGQLFVYAITLGQIISPLTSLLKKLVCNNYKGKGMKQNSRSGGTKFSQAEQVVLGLLDISLCNF